MKISKLTLISVVVSLAMLSGCQRNNSASKPASNGAQNNKQNPATPGKPGSSTKPAQPAAPAKSGSPFDVSRLTDNDLINFEVVEVGYPENLKPSLDQVAYLSGSVSDLEPKNILHQSASDPAHQHTLFGGKGEVSGTVEVLKAPVGATAVRFFPFDGGMTWGAFKAALGTIKLTSDKTYFFNWAIINTDKSEIVGSINLSSELNKIISTHFVENADGSALEGSSSDVYGDQSALDTKKDLDDYASGAKLTDPIVKLVALVEPLLLKGPTDFGPLSIAQQYPYAQETDTVRGDGSKDKLFLSIPPTMDPKVSGAFRYIGVNISVKQWISKDDDSAKSDDDSKDNDSN